MIIYEDRHQFELKVMCVWKSFYARMRRIR